MRNYNEIIQNDIPSEAAPMLDKLEAKYGYVPNVTRGMAAAPEVLSGYISLSNAFEESSLSKEEQQIVLLTASRFNECGYCTSVHSVTAEKAGLDWDTIEKIRNREKISNERYEMLRRFTETVTESKGSVPRDMQTAFQDAGFTTQNALDVILGVSLKTLTNSTNHLIETPLDEQFQKRAWSPADAEPAFA